MVRSHLCRTGRRSQVIAVQNWIIPGSPKMHLGQLNSKGSFTGILYAKFDFIQISKSLIFTSLGSISMEYEGAGRQIDHLMIRPIPKILKASLSTKCRGRFLSLLILDAHTARCDSCH